MQMCGTWCSAKTELVLNCFKADPCRHDLLQGRKGAESSPWGLLCRPHCSWNLWELCFECTEIFVHGLLVSSQRCPKINWSFWHLSLCSCITLGFLLVRGFLVFPQSGILTWGDRWLKDRHAIFLQPLYAGKKMNTACCTENIIVGCRNTLFPLYLYHGLWMWCWAHHTPSTFQQWPRAVLYVEATVVARINGQHCRFLAVICLWINSPVTKITVIMVWFCRGEWKTKVL